VPRYLAVVESFDAIGMTASGKVQKNKLREHAIQRFNLGTAHAHSPTSPAGLTRGSIASQETSREEMDCRVKPGNEESLA